MFTATRGATRRLLAIMAVTTLALATSVTSVVAWTPPSLEALCASDENSYSWRITLTTEPDYWIELSWNADFSDDWDVDFGSAGQHQFDTPRGGSVLYARWKNDTAKKTSAQANAVLCEQPVPDDHASLNIKKQDENGKGLPGAVFTVEGMEDTFVTDERGFFCITGLPEDSVWLVTEIQAPEGYVIADPASQMVEVDDDGDCDSPDARFVNMLEPDIASLNVKKEDENGHGLAGAIFTVEGMEGTFVTDEDGFFCITGLPEDSVWLVTEIQAPEGYELADPASQMVEVDNDGDCNSPDARFVNLPIEEEPPVEEPPVEEPPAEEPPVEKPDQGVKGDQGGPGPELPDTALGADARSVTWFMPIGILIFGLSLASVAVRANRGNRR
jgi:hypothetical protein